MRELDKQLLRQLGELLETNRYIVIFENRELPIGSEMCIASGLSRADSAYMLEQILEKLKEGTP